MKLRLSEYQTLWKNAYEQEIHLLKTLFEEEVIKFEHFGSTAIPGMIAKPVIDIICIVADIEKVDASNKQLSLLGYEAAGEWGIDGRRLFRKGGNERTHHLHCYQAGNPHIDRHLILRDYLIAHQEEAESYSSFKKNLAKQFDTTAEYSAAKKVFVAEMEKRAMQWYGNNRRKYWLS
ncbi:GrpB family protein [Lysinibacillus odysseyi]|uniref:Glutamate-rich protein GrpB n=1 Tax=Lysinibacillus odysseyi 34hs-1 = NBRC 100172 TaxID=1220589 RepID=A0A0A3IAT2_9BACI|nr:GrpB family protein [Lysinibacillus odysseyi]KGR81799.1 hypothetical protein CD32_20940 [Lysinibacillus odysseyi 34hs-1 = NBRC 100172]